jgi:hypothetical protein
MLTIRSRLAALADWERRHDGPFLRRPGDPLGDHPEPEAATAAARTWSRQCDRQAQALVRRLAVIRRAGAPPPAAGAELAGLRCAGLAWRDAALPPPRA